MKFAISSLAFQHQKIESIIEIAQQNRLTLEFSSGLPYLPNMVEIFHKARIPKLLHNYFPAPKVPFVLNLASLNEEVSEKSVLHCINGMRLASKSDYKFFAAHAGFCHDPSPGELGGEFKIVSSNQKKEFWDKFILNVNFLLQHAEKLDVDLYIENNVCIKENVMSQNFSPLFCSDINSTLDLVQEINHPRLKILLDTAHLKVSARSLKFDPNEFINKFKKHIGAIHHSDNDGFKDTNERIDSDYWFLPYMYVFSNCLHVLEVANLKVDEINFQKSILKKAINNA